VNADEAGGGGGEPSDFQDLFYMFARSTVTNSVYVSTIALTENGPGEQSFWKRIEELENITQILGAVPHKNGDKRSIYVFMRTQDKDDKVSFATLDLDAPDKALELAELALPQKTYTSQVLVVQRIDDGRPPSLVVTTGRGVYLRRLDREGSSWEAPESPESPGGKSGNSAGTDEWAPYRLNSLDEHVLGDLVLPEIVVRALNAALEVGGPLDDSKHQILTEIVLYFTDDDNNYHVVQVPWAGASYFVRHHWPATGEPLGAALDDSTLENIFAIFSSDLGASHRQVLVAIGDFISNENADPGTSFSYVSSLERVVPHFRSAEAPDSHKHLIHYLSDAKPGWYHFVLDSFSNDPIEQSRTRVAPFVKDVSVDGSPSFAFDISDRLSSDQLQIKRSTIKQWYVENSELPLNSPTNVVCLQEAYYLVPVLLGIQLLSVGEPSAALDWLRTVIDYHVPKKLRKIYYGLTLEENEPAIYQRGANWLLDPLNPHEIAATRKNTYTRFTIMAIVRCLLDHADAEFTRDTPESVPRARLLYLKALELLDEAGFSPGFSACDEVIGTLDIEVGDKQWIPSFDHIQKDLAGIGELATLKTVAAKLMVILASNATLSSRFATARALIADAKASLPKRPRMSSVVQSRGDVQARVHAALLSQPEVAAAVADAGALAGRDLLTAVSLVSGVSISTLRQGKAMMPWLRQPLSDGAATVPLAHPGTIAMRTGSKDLSRSNRSAPSHLAALVSPVVIAPMNAVTAKRSLGGHYIPAPTFHFCVPANPIPRALRLHAELNLFKIRTCRNIAGMKRELDPYAAPTDTTSGMPVIGAGGQLVLPGLARLRPTPYRYAALIERAKQMVGLAQQIEASFLSAIEKGDAERYSMLKARQDVGLTRAGVRLQTLRVKEAQDGVKLAELQQQRAQIQVNTYQNWISAGMNDAEIAALAFTVVSAMLQAGAGAAALAGPKPDESAALANFAGSASAYASYTSMLASYERKVQEWTLQENLAQQDVAIAGEQITIANDNVRVADQELTIAGIQAENAKAVVDFLSNKFTNVELYDWMSDVLEGVYTFFLQQATTMAQLAASQLAFERQEVPRPYIQADYWQAPADGFGSSDGKAPDRRGLTGSARLLQDIYQLDQYAFDTNKRKLQLTKTISLAQPDPLAFQQFRETGVLPFDTPMEMFDRDFPGHYLRLIRRVRVSVIALIPPSQGIRATLTTTGASRVVIGGDIFQTVRTHRGPDEVALSSPSNATGLFELDTQPELLLPFEGIGVDTHWELRMPRAANPFDFSTFADVLFTVDYTALNSFDYYQQVIQTLRPTLSADRPYSFRQVFADQWYDLHNPELTATPMTVCFSTTRGDFPPNLEKLKIEHVVLYFARAQGKSFEVPVTNLTFTEVGGNGAVGGGAMSVDGVISTRRGNAGSWMAMLSLSPFGDWELALPNTELMRSRFANEEFEDILLVLTFTGRTPAWPA
jgi:hypothetical protein